MGDIGDQIFQGVGEMLPVIAVGIAGGPVAAKALSRNKCLWWFSRTSI